MTLYVFIKHRVFGKAGTVLRVTSAGHAGVPGSSLVSVVSFLSESLTNANAEVK